MKPRKGRHVVYIFKWPQLEHAPRLDNEPFAFSFNPCEFLPSQRAFMRVIRTNSGHHKNWNPDMQTFCNRPKCSHKSEKMEGSLSRENQSNFYARAISFDFWNKNRRSESPLSLFCNRGSRVRVPLNNIYVLCSAWCFCNLLIFIRGRDFIVLR